MKTRKISKLILPLLLSVIMLLGDSMPVMAAPITVSLSNITFDADYYYNTYSDLQSAIGYDYNALYRHYIEFGLKEGRSGSAQFNCMTYCNNYIDLRVTFRDDYVAYCLHYEQYGLAEGRNATEPLHTELSSDIATGTILGSYATSYNPNIQRAINVELAAYRINGVTLEPGQEFSFSQTILPRTPENGYVTAPVINAGAMTTGYGGGICQVSSTLYAAMIVAGLPATERHPHSLKVSYIPEGLDATISTPYKDLKFINIYDTPIQINATTDTETGTLTISLSGL